METQTANGHGNSDKDTSEETAANKPTILDKIHEDWVKAGKKDPDAKTHEALIAACEKAKAEESELEKKLDEVRTKRRKAETKLIAAYGGGKGATFKIYNGQYVATARGEQVFFKEVSNRRIIGG